MICRNELSLDLGLITPNSVWTGWCLNNTIATHSKTSARSNIGCYGRCWTGHCLNATLCSNFGSQSLNGHCRQIHTILRSRFNDTLTFLQDLPITTLHHLYLTYLEEKYKIYFNWMTETGIPPPGCVKKLPDLIPSVRCCNLMKSLLLSLLWLTTYNTE